MHGFYQCSVLIYSTTHLSFCCFCCSYLFKSTMGHLFSRKSRIYNDCPEEIQMEVLENPGPFVDKKISIPPGCYKDVSYETLDNSYNRDRSKRIGILRQGQGEYEEECIFPYDIRVCGKIKLTLVDDKEKNKKKVHIDRIKGNFFLRIGYNSRESINFILYFLLCLSYHFYNVLCYIYILYLNIFPQ